MRKVIVSSIAFAMMSWASAGAADLPPRAAPAPVPYKAPITVVSSWTGCYVGANGGGGFGTTSWFDPTDEGSASSTGGEAGGQIGCDYQAGAFVFGAQGMGDWASITGSHTANLFPGLTQDSKISGIFSATARIGFTVVPEALLYVKGGGAWVRSTYTDNCSAGLGLVLGVVCPGTANVTRSGWLVGGGGEYMFTPNLSAFLEYNYIDLGTRTTTLTYADGSLFDYQIRQNVQTVMFGLNYRFGGPVVARY